MNKKSKVLTGVLAMAMLLAVMFSITACSDIKMPDGYYQQEESKKEETSTSPSHNDYTVMAKLPNGEVVFSKKGEYTDVPSYVYFTATDGTQYKVNKEDVAYFVEKD